MVKCPPFLDINNFPGFFKCPKPLQVKDFNYQPSFHRQNNNNEEYI